MAYKNPEDARAYERRRHAKHQAEYVARQGEGYRTRYRIGMLKRVYGLSEPEFLAMKAEQRDCCAACKEPFSMEPHVDHCHATNVVRGLLCSPCNRTIGHAKEDVERLIACGIYLEGRK